MRGTATRLCALALAALTALALAGCKSRPYEGDGTRFGVTPPAAGPTAAPAEPRTGEPEQTAALPSAEETPPKAFGEAAPAQVDARPERLMGLARTAVDTELGRPELVRREAPAEVWQYRARACVLEVFFYPTQGEPEVLHLEARDAESAEPVPAATCLETLLRRERGRRATG